MIGDVGRERRRVVAVRLDEILRDVSPPPLEIVYGSVAVSDDYGPVGGLREGGVG